MNLTNLRAQVRKRLGDANAEFWTNDELDVYINDACRDIAFRTKSIKDDKKISTISCEENTDSAKSNEYGLASNFPNVYSVLQVYLLSDGKRWVRIDPLRRDDLDEEYEGWRSDVGYTYTDPDTGDITYNKEANTSEPQYYYWNREEDYIGLYPMPDDNSAGSEYLHVYYSKKHTDISGGDSPTIPEPLHIAVINFAAATGFEDRGWGERANDQWTKYYTRLKDYKIETNREREDDEVQSMNTRNL